MMKRVGVFTNRYDTAKYFIVRYEEHSIYKTKKKRLSRTDIYIEFANGDYIEWIRPVESSRGKKPNEAYIGLDVTQEQNDTIVLPMCMYCDERDIIRGDLNKWIF